MRESPEPLYRRLKEWVAEKIESGEWPPGHRLPPELKLAAEFSLSRATVRQAMNLLVHQGLIERTRGSGTFVARPKVAHNLLGAFSIAEDVLRAGATPRVRVLGIDRRKPLASVVARLGLAANEDVYEVRRLILADDEPLILVTNWLPAQRFPRLEDKPLQRGMGTVFREIFGVECRRQHKEVEVTTLDEQEAALLEVAAHTPALLVSYVSYSAENEPFEYRKMVVRGDRCKYFVDLDAPEPLV